MELGFDTPPRLVAATFPPYWSPQFVASPTSLFRQRGEWNQGPLLDLPSPANCHEITAEVSVTDSFPSRTLETWRFRMIRYSSGKKKPAQGPGFDRRILDQKDAPS